MKTHFFHDKNNFLICPLLVDNLKENHLNFTFADDVSSCDIDTAVVTQILCIFYLINKQVIVLNIITPFFFLRSRKISDD